MLLRYSVVQLTQYLREVECNPGRGPEVAAALRGAVHEAVREPSNVCANALGHNPAFPVGRR